MTWSALRILPSDSDKGGGRRGGRDAIVAALFASGAQALVEDGAAIVTHFPEASDLAQVRAAIHAADPGATLTESPVADEDWSVAWRARVTAQQAGLFTVTPPWLASTFDPGRTIIIDPAMAFGTGDHASTRGVLRLIAAVLRAGDLVADLGAGSGVLAIAAAKLGASRVYAIESDADAISNAVANVRENAVGDRVHVLEGDARTLLPLVAPVQLVLANIISSVLRDLLPSIEGSLAAEGRAILSGLLLSERTAFCAILNARGWQILDESSEDEWWTVAIAKT